MNGVHELVYKEYHEACIRLKDRYIVEKNNNTSEAYLLGGIHIYIIKSVKGVN